MIQEEMRMKLMDSVMQVVAREGLENTTTMKVAKVFQLGEANIFRIFGDKNELLKQTFVQADSTLCHAAMMCFPVLRDESFPFEIRMRLFFLRCWKYLMEHPDLCCFYSRYYHSAQCTKNFSDEDAARCCLLLQAVEAQFRNGKNVRLLFNHALDMLLGFAMKTISGELADQETAFNQMIQLLNDAIGDRMQQALSQDDEVKQDDR